MVKEAVQGKFLKRYPAPGHDDLSSVGKWRHHSGFIVFKDTGNDVVEYTEVTVPDGISPLVIAKASGVPLKRVGYVSADRSKYGMFPSEVASKIAAASIYLGLAQDCTSIYFCDGSIEGAEPEGDGRIRNVEVIYDEAAQRESGEPSMMRVWPGGKVAWEGEIPETISKFLDERFETGVAVNAFSALNAAIGKWTGDDAIGYEHAAFNANKMLDLFEKITFGVAPPFSNRFSTKPVRKCSAREQWMLKNISFQQWKETHPSWMDEVIATAPSVIKIWFTVCAAGGHPLNQMDKSAIPFTKTPDQEMTESIWVTNIDKTIGTGYECGVDFALKAYFNGTAIEYVLAGME